MNDLHDIAARYILVDHFDMVYDLEKSVGNRLFDKKHNRFLLDAFSFIASNPIGHNHSKMFDKAFEEKLLRVARTNPSNSDILTEEYVQFLQTFFDIAVPSHFTDSFFIAGGTLAVENALKAAFDWKYRKLLARGIKSNPDNFKVAHFKNAFHGRSGYSLTLTNTADPRKYTLFPKFPNWPRLEAPVACGAISEHDQFLLDEYFYTHTSDRLQKIKTELAAIIIEPIQGEGGDNHFSKHFHKNLRKLADEQEALLIYDEVQTGVGLTGKMWAHQLYDVEPDIICFGKKMQVCGILSGQRVRSVKNNVFEEKSRINSTWGGNLVDMVRAQRYLEIIKEDNLVENAATVGAYMLEKLKELGLTNARGAGLMCAFDMKNPTERNELTNRCLENGLFLLGCGTHSVRVRPSLTFTKDDVDEMVHIIQKSV